MSGWARLGRVSWWSDCKYWIPRALHDRARCDGNEYIPHWPKRWWVTFKGILSLLLCYELPLDDGYEVAQSKPSATFHHEFGEGASWDVLIVAWRGLGYYVENVGYP